MVSAKRRKNSSDVEEEVEGKKTRPDYPCTFRTILTLLNDLGPKIRDDHVKVLKDTPFWSFIDCIRSGVVDNKWTQKYEKDIALVINCFNKLCGEFFFGEVALAPQEVDVKLIFGIRDGPDEIVVPREPTKTGLISRRYPEKLKDVYDVNGEKMHLKLTVAIIAKKLREIVDSTDEIDVEDFARLLTLHVIATFFAPVASVFRWGYFDFVEDIESMCDYNWSKHILQQLLDSMTLKNDKHTGCVMFLLYWLCEKTRMVKSTRVDFIPRFAKWNLRVVNGVLGNINLPKLDKRVVITTPIKMTVAEATFLEGSPNTNEPHEHSIPAMDLGGSSNGKKEHSGKKVVNVVEKENINLIEVVTGLENEIMSLKAVAEEVDNGNKNLKEVEMENTNLKEMVKEIEKENMNLKEEMKDKDKLLRDIRSLLKIKATNAENKDREIKILEGLNDFMEAKLDKVTKENDDLKLKLSQMNRGHGATVLTEEGGGKKQKTVH